ncbi:MAG: phasin family protein [bacterium]|nr:phasin family protein [bacterium]
MKDFIKKATEFAAQTEEKANELIYELYKKGKIGSKEAKKMTIEWAKRIKKNASTLQKKLDGQIHQAIHKLNIPTRKEIEDIEKRLNALEKTKKLSVKPRKSKTRAKK